MIGVKMVKPPERWMPVQPNGRFHFSGFGSDNEWCGDETK